ncbi:E3 ubiquitin/ISG15 ligase TRIM25-like [Dendrobates tinctorius]|uniref:E3 ubiquitin/ISG15 ligase TRIM25-like n=1 Tax=Dendrobates tinctorius TaxID=92724 RepID=UPI003CCA2EDC
MASADLRDELSCSICLDIYTDPVTLSCGHTFCQDCIARALDAQGQVGVYSCPDCREAFLERPSMRRNVTLGNIAQGFLSAPEAEVSGVYCTFCDFPVLAMKSCVQCETSMCYHHLMRHDRSVDHKVTPPRASPRSRKCIVHHKVLEYYCCVDSVCICGQCVLSGHSGHKVQSLSDATQMMKETMRNVLQNLTTAMEEMEKSIQSLREGENQEKVNGLTKRVVAMLGDIRGQLDALEEKVLSEISRQKEQVSLSILGRIQYLELQKKELFEKMSRVKELSTIADPITLLQESPPGVDFWDAQVRVREKKCSEDERHGVDHLNEGLISEIFEEALLKIMTSVKSGLSGPRWTSLLLDINTAGNHVHLSDDFKTASWSKGNQTYPETSERFQYPQILSTDVFRTGQHYWEVETSDTGGWRVGICYPTMDRTGDESYIGDNEKSWCLRWQKNQYSVLHDNVETMLSPEPLCHRLRMCLDYEAGTLSFYETCDPNKHLHTFTATFTEPLHVGFRLLKSWVKIINPEE